MIKSSTLILLALLAAGCVCHRPTGEWTRGRAVTVLESHCDRFLDDGDEASRAELAPLVTAEFLVGAYPGFPPTYITRMRSEEGSNLIVCVHAELRNRIRSAPQIEVFFVPVEDNGCWGHQEFSTGHASQITKIETIRPARSSLPIDILVFHTAAQFPYTGVRKHFYALRAENEWGEAGLALVRIEDQNGQPVYLDYRENTPGGSGHWTSTAGPLVVGDEWRQGDVRPSLYVTNIEKGGAATLLSTLYFLCGSHDMTHPQWKTAEVTVPRALLDTGILAGLLKDKHPWVREYAKRLQEKLKE